MRVLSSIAVLTILVFSCSQDIEETQPNLILGSWENTHPIEGENLIQLHRYVFHADRSFDLSRVIINPSTSEIVGYRAKASGIYEINKNRLTLIESERYIHNDYDRLYSDIEDLEPTEFPVGTTQVSFSLDEEQNQLTFQYDPCGINENCISSQIFNRLE